MDKPVSELYQILTKLTGLHRQLLDTVRLERQALTQADLKGIEETAAAKQALVEAIRAAESERLRKVAALGALWKKHIRELTLPNVIIIVQGEDLKLAEQFRSAYNALTILIQRITEQNDDNKALVERSLEHVREMKRNVLGESVPKSDTYTAHAQRSNGPGGARFISKEA